MATTSISSSNPSWFTPKRLLVVFCIINLINYVDRGAIASNGVNGSTGTCTGSGTCTAGSGIQGDFNLSNFEDGVLSSAFMVGLLLASPVFATLARSINPFRLIGVGLSVWTVAVVGCGLSFNFWSIAICRMFVGVGEASFISLAAPFIDDQAPADQKTAWLGIFYMCIPTGYALGYVYGGLVGGYSHWRFAFLGEAIVMLPFVVLGFIIKPLHLKGFTSAYSKKASADIAISEAEDEAFAHDKTNRLSVNGDSRDKSLLVAPISSNQFSKFVEDMKILLREKVFVTNVLALTNLSFLGYVAYNFVIGAYSYWGPKAGYNIYKMENADMIFGGITIFCGIVGTLGGSFLLDYVTPTISNAFKLLSAATFFGGILCFVAFCFKSMYIFLALFAIGELLVFATQGPVNYISLHCVKPSLRPLSMAISTVSIHIFGDVPSSPLVGVLEDYVHNWRLTSLVLTAVLFPASAIWFIGVFLHSVDRSDEENEHQATAPLLEERMRETTTETSTQP